VPGLNAGGSPGRREDFSGYAREVDARHAITIVLEPRSFPIRCRRKKSMAAIFASSNSGGDTTCDRDGNRVTVDTGKEAVQPATRAMSVDGLCAESQASAAGRCFTSWR